MSIILTLLIFTVIVVIHEAGHMVVAKKFNVLVSEFAIGMGPKLWGFKKGDTTYNIRLLPLGGFCRMEEEVEGRDDVISFNDTTPIQKILICFAGPFMNFLLAFVLMAIISLCGPVLGTGITNVSDGSPASEIGLEVGDKIVAVNGHSVHSINEIDFFKNGGSKADELVVKRNGEKISYTITPAKSCDRYIYGVSLTYKAPYINVFHRDYGNMVKGELWEYIAGAFWSVIFLIKVTVISFIRLITAKVAVTELSGPIGVTSVVGQEYSQSISYGLSAVVLSMSSLTVLLSANLGVLNLFPLPALDGGRIVISLIELVTRRKVPEKIEGFIHFAGFVLLMGFGVYIAFNDVLKLL